MTTAEIALIISGISAFISVGTFGFNQMNTYRSRERVKVMAALDALTSESIAKARVNIGSVARNKETLSEAEKDAFAVDAYQLMLVIQRSAFAAKTIKKTALAVDEAIWLYLHLGLITTDLSEAIKKHGHGIELTKMLDATNKVIESLPKSIRNSWSWRVGRSEMVTLVKPEQIEATEEPKAL